MDTKLPM
jgi:hypothetical protein